MDGFASLAVFPDRIRAEMVADALREADIPVLVRAPSSTGLFAPAPVDALTGAEVLVPRDRLNEARAAVAPWLEGLEDRE